jgi:hypothetical protein
MILSESKIVARGNTGLAFSSSPNCRAAEICGRCADARIAPAVNRLSAPFPEGWATWSRKGAAMTKQVFALSLGFAGVILWLQAAHGAASGGGVNDENSPSCEQVLRVFPVARAC